MQPVDVTARATGAGVDNGPQCIIALDHTADRAVNFTGTSSVPLGCGVASNSSRRQAISVGGNATLVDNPPPAFGGIVLGKNGTSMPERPLHPSSQLVARPHADH